MSPARLECDLAVIGAGLAGTAAALYTAQAGLSVVQAGGSGAMAYTSGYFDLLGAIPPTGEGSPAQRVDDALAGLPALLAAHPSHPYRLTPPELILEAFTRWLGFLADCGLPHRLAAGRNLVLPSPAGTLKRSFAAPETTAGFSALLAAGEPCLLADFHGLNGYSAAQIAANLAPAWPGLRVARLAFPGHAGGELYAENAARSLELPRFREALAAALRPHLDGVTSVGLPALLGLHRPDAVRDDLAERLGVAVFEIPTLPPSVPGIRLREAVEERLPGLGVVRFSQQMVRLERLTPDGLELAVTGGPRESRVFCRGAVLATGRFLAGGLAADRAGVRETVFGLPVAQPAERRDWHRSRYFDPRGHAVNASGVEVDEHFRPLGPDGRAFHPRLYAAGSVLAHADWMRMKCGAGVALATALGAAKAFVADAG